MANDEHNQINMPLEEFWFHLAQRYPNIIIGDTGHTNPDLHAYFANTSFLSPLRQGGVEVFAIELHQDAIQTGLDFLRTEPSGLIDGIAVGSSGFNLGRAILNGRALGPIGDTAAAAIAHGMDVEAVDVNFWGAIQDYLISQGYSENAADRFLYPQDRIRAEYEEGDPLGWLGEIAMLPVNGVNRLWNGTIDIVFLRNNGFRDYPGMNDGIADNHAEMVGDRRSVLLIGNAHMRFVDGSDANGDGVIDTTERDLDEIIPNSVFVEVYDHENPDLRNDNPEGRLWTGGLPDWLPIPMEPIMEAAAGLLGTTYSRDMPDCTVFLETDAGGPRIIENVPGKCGPRE